MSERPDLDALEAAVEDGGIRNMAEERRLIAYARELESERDNMISQDDYHAGVSAEAERADRAEADRDALREALKQEHHEFRPSHEVPSEYCEACRLLSSSPASQEEPK